MDKIDPQEIPMMYRAQIQKRCSLQFRQKRETGKPTHIEQWTEEWLDPREGETQPRHQYLDVPEIIADGTFCRIKMQFPFRVLSNCGQDSFIRPPIDGCGIPFIPGSSIKGLFLRACKERDLKPENKVKLTQEYCGRANKIAQLRFHGAYPIGDWAATKQSGDRVSYRMVDVVHSQQSWQIGDDNWDRGTNAIAQISLYQPTLIFEISSRESLSKEEWQTIVYILKAALRPGLGGRTSIGYGLAPYPPRNQNEYDVSAYLHGKGITPVLLSGEPEFRPNIFKATLRGHFQRLLAGCTSDSTTVKKTVGRLFGNENNPARIEIYWDGKPQTEWSYTYDVRGQLYIIRDPKKEESFIDKDRQFIQLVFKFAYTIAGWGKSWRRVWHQDFYEEPNYDKLIGCHWKSDEKWLTDITSQENLSDFLNKVEKSAKDYLNQRGNNCLDWRESWHRDRLAVYSNIVTKSQAIALFHQEPFRTTPAIGGRKPNDEAPTSVSCVWHRMLPIDNGKYLEIVTVFHGGQNSGWCKQWERKESDQLVKFTNQLIDKGLQFTWGTPPHN